jgi:hypothetical protein
MRTALTLSGLGLALVLLSCNRQPEEEVSTPWCILKCQDPQIKLQLPFSADTLKGMYLVTYKNNLSFTDTVSVSAPYTVMVTAGYDYELFIPKLNKSYAIYYVSTYPSERSGKCGDTCPNAPSLSVQFGWQPHYFTMALTGRLEYTVHL